MANTVLRKIIYDFYGGPLDGAIVAAALDERVDTEGYVITGEAMGQVHLRYEFQKELNGR